MRSLVQSVHGEAGGVFGGGNDVCFFLIQLDSLGTNARRESREKKARLGTPSCLPQFWVLNKQMRGHLDKTKQRFGKPKHP